MHFGVSTDELCRAMSIIDVYETNIHRDCDVKTPNTELRYEKNLKINGDIYSLAFCALLDPDEIDLGIDGAMPDVNNNKKEIENLYLGALFVISF